MSGGSPFEEINEAKTKMDSIYDQADPRAYFRELKKLDYAIPSAAKPIFQKLISRLRPCRNDPLRILDLGCSYGVNAALLKHDLSMRELYHHWGQERLTNATTQEVIEYDRRFFANLDKADDIEVIGLDQADNAVAFAEETGLLDEGFAVNLETEPLPEPAKEELAAVDLVVSTGCIGYVTEKTFDRLLPAVIQDQLPWIANFVLRMFPFDVIGETLKKWGYLTEKLESKTFVQRQFASVEERERVLERLRERGVDPSGKEAENHLLAELYLSRPREEAAVLPLERLLAA